VNNNPNPATAGSARGDAYSRIRREIAPELKLPYAWRIKIGTLRNLCKILEVLEVVEAMKDRGEIDFGSMEPEKYDSSFISAVLSCTERNADHYKHSLQALEGLFERRIKKGAFKQ